MKAKTAVIAVITAAAVAGGGIYGAYAYSASHKKIIKVMPVMNANLASWYYDDDSSASSVEGAIFTKDTQTVELRKEYLINQVFVKEGDSVKRGDPLMEYDMTLPELQKEMEEINKQILEQQLAKQEKTLERLQTNPNSVSSDDDSGVVAALEAEDSDDLTQSADELIETASEGRGETLVEQEEAQSIRSAAEDPSSEEDIFEDGGESGGDGTGDQEPDVIETDPEDPAPVIDDPDAGDADIEDDPSDDNPDSGLIDEDDSGEGSEAYDGLILSLGEFRSLESRVGQAYSNGSLADERSSIARAIKIYQSELSDPPSEMERTLRTISSDVLGNYRQVGSYLMSDTVSAALMSRFSGSAADAMQQEEKAYRAYVNLLYYQLVDSMDQIDAALKEMGVTAETATAAQIKSISPLISQAVAAYYQYDTEYRTSRTSEWESVSNRLMDKFSYTADDLDTVYTAYFQNRLTFYLGDRLDPENGTGGLLSKLSDRLKDSGIVEEPETEPQTEAPKPDDGGDGYDDDFGGDDPDAGSGLSAEEIAEMIEEQKMQIAETKLQIRELELKIKSYDRTLEGKTIKATLDGKVTAAGTADGQGDANAFIVVRGAKGMYVTANINEMKRDTIKIGDTITGISYMGSQTSFTAVVTEVSPYPTESETYSYYYGSDADNPNSSFYPVTAYIEETSGLSEGYAQVTFPENTSAQNGASGKLYLQNYYVRTDSTDRSYVYVAGQDGLLERRYVKTGGSLWGTGIEIKAGLSLDDLIAFPYGRGVKEGAQTKQVDDIESDDE